ncbi:MAG: eccD [Amycolatopsis sp.]|jgi:type VII secretion integral membrane protein EccD|uniref:type VII secretion integral membrane protein EccD n=1 Tax=Amycolatopsis sp. TaxID=37632 RepID=UPI00262814FC|nr:type VII secretion integral membrane protein EccD [Amycolatopsis sp.]MCU1682697.1 eccD [Amycolatopsis sp.]
MTSAQQAELCRITVFGPGGRADLAVPLSISVASLLPVLLRHTGGRDEFQDSWALQRLGDAPLDPAGTPESLDWKEGEEFYLRPRADPLPELDFDDIADGMATAVNRQPGRWKPEFNRWLFLGFSVGALLVLARVLVYPGTMAFTTGAAAVIALGLLVSAIIAGVQTEDKALILLLGLGGCGFSAFAGAVGLAGLDPALDLQGGPILVGGLALAFAGAILLGARVFWAPVMPFIPFGTVVAIGLLAAVAQWLHLGVLLSTVQVAGLLSAVLIGVLVFAPRIGIRLARIRGPQLPRTADELQFDIEAAPAAQMVERTAYADGYLTMGAVASAVVFACSFPFLMDQGLFPAILALLIAIAAVLRCRALLGAWQRVSLGVAGAFGLVVVALSIISPLAAGGRGVSLALLLLVFSFMVMAMLRPPPRRLLPIWAHLANWLETLSAVAVVPVLLQLFGVYAWASGLAR